MSQTPGRDLLVSIIVPVCNGAPYAKASTHPRSDLHRIEVIRR